MTVMFFKILSVAAACAAASLAHAQAPTASDLLSVGLPWVEVTTVGGEEPTCEYIGSPPYGTGSGIANATKVPGRLLMAPASTTAATMLMAAVA